MRISHLSLPEKSKPHLGPSASQDQTSVLAGLAFSPSPDERRKVIITRPWSLPMSAPGKILVLCMLNPDRLKEDSKDTMKEDSKVVNRDWVNHQACRMSNNICILASAFISHGIFILIRKLCLP